MIYYIKNYKQYYANNQTIGILITVKSFIFQN